MQKQSLNSSLSGENNKKYELILDIGTSGIKAFVFDEEFNVISKAHGEIQKYSPETCWVEQDPKELLSVSINVLRRAIEECNLPESSFVGFGLVNQRETTILWNKVTGEPVYPAIGWEDNRTDKECLNWQKQFGEIIRNKTGLNISPYFSAGKIWWVLQNIPLARQLLEKNNLVFGTVDTWILWNIMEDKSRVTDYTNASRTLLFNIKTLEWDKELLDIFKISSEILPQVKPSQDHFGMLRKDIVGFALPILAVCGDQQASLYAVGTDVGTTKITFGTGTFIMQIIGKEFKIYPDFFTTLTPCNNGAIYAVESKINSTGEETRELLKNPAGLKKYLTQIAGEVDTIINKLPIKPGELIIDGGITRDGLLAGILSDISKIQVRQQKTFDGTALGTAMLVKLS